MSDPAGPQTQRSDDTIPLERVRFVKEAYPREGYNPDRVEEFADLYRERGPDALPPITVVRPADGSQAILVDGLHRKLAAEQAGLEALPVRASQLLPGADPTATAFVLAVTASAVSSLPLTRAEKQAAIRRLLADHPARPDREIARIVGVAHTTVSRARKRCNAPATAPADNIVSTRPTFASADEVASRLVSGVSKLYEARGLLDGIRGGDAVMGKRLARAFTNTHDEHALEWAQRFSAWTIAAVTELEGEESG